MPDKSAKGIDRRDLIMASIATVGAAAAVAVKAGAANAQDATTPPANPASGTHLADIDADDKHVCFWGQSGHHTMVSSEWGTPDMFEDGLIAEKILGSEYGHRLHFWDLLKRRHLQEIDLGKEYQLVFELRPAHDPTKAYGFAGVVLCLVVRVSLAPRRRPVGNNQGDLNPGRTRRARPASSHAQRLQSLSTVCDGHRPLR